MFASNVLSKDLLCCLSATQTRPGCHGWAEIIGMTSDDDDFGYSFLPKR